MIIKFSDVPTCPGVFVYRGYVWVKYAKDFAAPMALVPQMPDIEIKPDTEVFAAGKEEINA